MPDPIRVVIADDGKPVIVAASVADGITWSLRKLELMQGGLAPDKAEAVVQIEMLAEHKGGTLNSSSIFTEATIRGVLTAFLNAALVFLSSIQMGMAMNAALIIAGQVFIVQVLLRVFGEGAYDARRSATGNVINADVGSREVVTRTSVPTTPPEPETTTTTTVTTNPDTPPAA